MNANELRKKYLEFFESKGHKIIPSASLIPENDPTVLFTTAGMHPLVPFLMGQKHPLGKRLCNVQKCIRTGDIDEVGDEVHHTFFEMMGNWSLGDYFKKEAIEMSFEFLTKCINIPIEKLVVTCFKGDENAPKDEEVAEIWRSLGIPDERIGFLEKKENWWGPAGQSGPCGPDTEMFYWVGEKDAPRIFDPEDKRWVEIWNNVFMQYNKTKKGKYEPLTQKNVDTGLGLERVSAILQGCDDNYKTELFQPIIKKIEELANKSYEGNERSMRVIADHLKAATLIMGDEKGVGPSNLDQGYVVRKLIRRAINNGKKLGINNNFTKQIAETVIDIYKETYPELEKNKEFIFTEIEKEENKFKETLEKGLREFEKISKEDISGENAFLLYQSYGFPLEMTKELAEDNGIKVDEKGFRREFQQHQELSRTATEGKFKSGLADNSEETTKLHTATHLLLEALRTVLKNPELNQKGSNITPERLRFDFNFDRKLTDKEKQQAEDFVNDKIQKAIPIKKEEMTVEEAKAQGATGVFDARYGQMVSVYTIENVSKEICAGPHVNNTSELKHFKIKKEESSSAGVRRIKAVLVSQ